MAKHDVSLAANLAAWGNFATELLRRFMSADVNELTKLQVVHRMWSEQRPISPTEISALLYVDPSRVAKSLKALWDDGHVLPFGRERNGDRRERCYELTSSGHRLGLEVAEGHVKANKILFMLVPAHAQTGMRRIPCDLFETKRTLNLHSLATLAIKEEGSRGIRRGVYGHLDAATSDMFDAHAQQRPPFLALPTKWSVWRDDTNFYQGIRGARRMALHRGRRSSDCKASEFNHRKDRRSALFLWEWVDGGSGSMLGSYQPAPQTQSDVPTDGVHTSDR